MKMNKPVKKLPPTNKELRKILDTLKIRTRECLTEIQTELGKGLRTFLKQETGGLEVSRENLLTAFIIYGLAKKARTKSCRNRAHLKEE